MALLSCCNFRRAISPDPQPAMLADISQRARRFTLSSHSPSPAASSVDTKPLQEIFALAPKAEDIRETSTTSGHDVHTSLEKSSGVYRRDSSHRLHKVASKVRRRISRDSGMSKRSSTRNLRSSTSEEDTNRREELKRALHRRVQDEILEDGRVSDGSYDEDAIPIKTPRATWGRHEGSIQISPRGLSKAIRRSHSPARSSHTELNQRDLTQNYVPKSAAAALSRMLVQRGSHLINNSEDQMLDLTAATTEDAQPTQKYTFVEIDSLKRSPKTRSQSPLGRSDTVIRIPSSAEFEPLKTALANPKFLDKPGVPLAPPLPPMRLASISDSVAGQDWRLSFSGHPQASLPLIKGDSSRGLHAVARASDVYDVKIRPASEQLLHGAFGFRNHPVDDVHDGAKSTADVHTRFSTEHQCEPGREELEFGGIDGIEDSPPTSRLGTRTLMRHRVHSEGSEPDPVHLYTMHIPQRPASKPLLPSISLPQLQRHRRHKSYISGDSSQKFSVKPRSVESSSGSNSARVAGAWITPETHPASSLYSSQPESPASSKRGSILRINSLSDRLYQLKTYNPYEEIISVPASRLMSIDLRELERRTTDASFHSSNESLTNRELAAAETRISPLPRSNTLPKHSRFREDLDQISAELALKNPQRRRASKLDGSGEWRSPSTSPGVVEAASIWEKALRDHSQEDAAISHTRIGSNPPGVWEKDLREHSQLSHTRIGSNFLGPRDLDPKRGASISRKTQSRPVLLGNDLKAHLGAYTLPPRSRRPTLEGSRISTSPIPAASWARYPSHNRLERSSSPAGLSDQVYPRDFAITAPNASSETLPKIKTTAWDNNHPGTKKKSFGKQMLSSLGHLYRSQSQELQRRFTNEARGHRSSISEGGVLEYPELEMLGIISSPRLSPDIATNIQTDELMRQESEQQTLITPSFGSIGPPDDGSGDGAAGWSKLYTDCVVDAQGSDDGLSAAVRSDRGSERLGTRDTRRDGTGSGELRGSR